MESHSVNYLHATVNTPQRTWRIHAALLLLQFIAYVTDGVLSTFFNPILWIILNSICVICVHGVFFFRHQGSRDVSNRGHVYEVSSLWYLSVGCALLWWSNDDKSHQSRVSHFLPIQTLCLFTMCLVIIPRAIVSVVFGTGLMISSTVWCFPVAG